MTKIGQHLAIHDRSCRTEAFFSLTMNDLSLKLHICLQNIGVGETVSQIFDIALS